MNEPQIIICSCSNEAHQIIIRYDDELNLVYLQPHLTTYKGFFKRLVSAIKYLFKKDCDTWDTIIINDLNYLKLKEVVEFIEEGNKTAFIGSAEELQAYLKSI